MGKDFLGHKMHEPQKKKLVNRKTGLHQTLKSAFQKALLQNAKASHRLGENICKTHIWSKDLYQEHSIRKQHAFCKWVKTWLDISPKKRTKNDR